MKGNRATMFDTQNLERATKGIPCVGNTLPRPARGMYGQWFDATPGLC